MTSTCCAHALPNRRVSRGRSCFDALRAVRESGSPPEHIHDIYPCEFCFQPWFQARRVFIKNAWWRHQTETFSALLTICAGNSNVTFKIALMGWLIVSRWRTEASITVVICSLLPARYQLTHLPLDTMGAILADDIFKCIFLNENVRISIQISLKFVPNGPIDNNSALVQVMAWRRTGDKRLPEAMLIQFIDAYMRH